MKADATLFWVSFFRSLDFTALLFGVDYAVPRFFRSGHNRCGRCGAKSVANGSVCPLESEFACEKYISRACFNFTLLFCTAVSRGV